MIQFFSLLGEHDGYVHLTNRDLGDPNVSIVVVEIPDECIQGSGTSKMYVSGAIGVINETVQAVVTISGRKCRAIVTAKDPTDMILWCFPETSQ